MDLAQMGIMNNQGVVALVEPGLTQPGWAGPCRMVMSR